MVRMWTAQGVLRAVAQDPEKADGVKFALAARESLIELHEERPGKTTPEKVAEMRAELAAAKERIRARGGLGYLATRWGELTRIEDAIDAKETGQ